MINPSTLDGGPAFPVPPNTSFDSSYCGMSLRDHFAAMALTSVKWEMSALNDVPSVYQRVAEHMYRMADAMIAERDK